VRYAKAAEKLKRTSTDAFLSFPGVSKNVVDVCGISATTLMAASRRSSNGRRAVGWRFNLSLQFGPMRWRQTDLHLSRILRNRL